MSYPKVISLTLGAAATYGVVHDQITARVCIEYFTVAHPPLFPTTSPTLLALCWGIAATSGVGLILGSVLAVVSESGTAVPVPVSRLAPRILRLLVVMGLCAFSAALLGGSLEHAHIISLPESLAAAIPQELHTRFMAVWFAHAASYASGLGGGGMLCYRIWRDRGRPRSMEVFPKSPAAIIRAIAVCVAAAVILWWRLAAD